MQQFTTLVEREDVKTVAYHDLALDEIREMFVACEGVASDHGFDSAEHIDMVRSLHKCLTNLFRVGFGRQAYITRDGNLSLLVQEGESFVFGMVFHRNRAWDNPPEGHYQPGTWSVHS